MKLIIKIIKRIIFALTLIYGFNMIMSSLDLFIPINIYTVSAISLLGFPGMFVLLGIITLI